MVGADLPGKKLAGLGPDVRSAASPPGGGVGGRGGPSRQLRSVRVLLGAPGHPPGQGACPADDRTRGRSRGVAGSLFLFLLGRGRGWGWSPCNFRQVFSFFPRGRRRRMVVPNSAGDGRFGWMRPGMVRSGRVGFSVTLLVGCREPSINFKHADPPFLKLSPAPRARLNGTR